MAKVTKVKYIGETSEFFTNGKIYGIYEVGKLGQTETIDDKGKEHTLKASKDDVDFIDANFVTV